MHEDEVTRKIIFNNGIPNRMDRIISKVIKLVKKYGIKKYTLNWKIKSRPVIRNEKQLVDYLNDILEDYHPHSFVELKKTQKRDEAKCLIIGTYTPGIGITSAEIVKRGQEIRENPDQKKPEIYTIEGIPVIKFYHFFGNESDSRQMVLETRNQIKSLNVSEGLIIDLREHFGGSVEPFINSMADILGETTLFAFGKREVKFDEPRWSNYDGSSSIIVGDFETVELKYKKKISVLVSKDTASAGEISAAIFGGRVNCKLFGDNTSTTDGSLSINKAFQINQDIILYLTVDLITTVDGIFQEDELLHVVKSKDIINDAINWLYSK